jgi:hypothetical protein
MSFDFILMAKFHFPILLILTMKKLVTPILFMLLYCVAFLYVCIIDQMLTF